MTRMAAVKYDSYHRHSISISVSLGSKEVELAQDEYLLDTACFLTHSTFGPDKTFFLKNKILSSHSVCFKSVTLKCFACGFEVWLCT